MTSLCSRNPFENSPDFFQRFLREFFLGIPQAISSSSFFWDPFRNSSRNMFHDFLLQLLEDVLVILSEFFRNSTKGLLFTIVKIVFMNCLGNVFRNYSDDFFKNFFIKMLNCNCFGNFSFSNPLKNYSDILFYFI